MRTDGSHGKGLPCTSVQRSRSNRTAKHRPTTTTLLWGAAQSTTVWPKIPTMEWTRSMAVWATMVSRAAGSRVHTTTSTNLATGTGSFFSEGWRTVCSVSYTQCMSVRQALVQTSHYRNLHQRRHHHCAQLQMSHSRTLGTDGSGFTTDKENKWWFPLTCVKGYNTQSSALQGCWRKALASHSQVQSQRLHMDNVSRYHSHKEEPTPIHAPGTRTPWTRLQPGHHKHTKRTSSNDWPYTDSSTCTTKRKQRLLEVQWGRVPD